MEHMRMCGFMARKTCIDKYIMLRYYNGTAQVIFGYFTEVKRRQKSKL